MKPALLLLCCKGCRTRDPFASITLDSDDGAPVLTTTRELLEKVRYSFVRDLNAQRDDARDDIPQKAILFCRRGHEIQLNIPPLMTKLAELSDGTRQRLFV